MYRYTNVYEVKNATDEYESLVGRKIGLPIVKVDGELDTGIAQGRKVMYWLLPEWMELYRQYRQRVLRRQQRNGT